MLPEGKGLRVYTQMDRQTHICLTGLLNKQHVGEILASAVSSDGKAQWEIKLATPLMGDDENAYRLL